MYLPLIAIFVAISGGMGISYMAESSSPGDPLYPIKVHVNDNFKQTATAPILEDSPSGTSSGSVYLKASPNNSVPINDDASSSSETMLSASTSLDGSQVINGE